MEKVYAPCTARMKTTRLAGRAGIGIVIAVRIEDHAVVVGHGMEASAADAFEHTDRSLDGLLEASPIGRLVIAKENDDVVLARRRCLNHGEQFDRRDGIAEFHTSGDALLDMEPPACHRIGQHGKSDLAAIVPDVAEELGDRNVEHDCERRSDARPGVGFRLEFHGTVLGLFIGFVSVSAHG